MHIIIAGGSGFVGKTLISKLLEQGVKISVVGRNEIKIKQIFSDRVQSITWQQLKQKEALKHIAGGDVLINLAGENISSGRWSAARKQEIIDSRVESTRILANLCVRAGSKAPTLLNANGIGIYGLQSLPATGLPTVITEQQAVPLESATDFIAQVGRLWDQATDAAVQAGVRVVKMRFAVILDQKGGALAKLLPAYRWGLGGKIGSGQQPFCWVALDDLIKAINFIIVHPDIQGAVNIVAPQAVTQHQFAMTLARTVNRHCFVTLPAWLIKLIFGQMGQELLLGGQHVVPEVLLQKGFKFDYPQLDQALQHILLR